VRVRLIDGRQLILWNVLPRISGWNFLELHITQQVFEAFRGRKPEGLIFKHERTQWVTT
jgi:hypothetical protein